VFGNALTEVCQVKIGKGNNKAAESEAAWERFVHAIAEAGCLQDNEEIICGKSLNLEERRWVGYVGWRNSEASSGILCWLFRWERQVS
jgi:hypothetical protein